INIQPQAAIENFPVEAHWTHEGTSTTVDDRIDFQVWNGYPCNNTTRAAVHVYDSRANNKDLGLLTQYAQATPPGYNTYWLGRWPDQNAVEKCYIRYYGTREQFRAKGLPKYVRLAIPSQTQMSNEINLGGAEPTPIPTATPKPVTCVPTLTSPANNANLTTVPPTLQWSNCGSGHYYQLNF